MTEVEEAAVVAAAIVAANSIFDDDEQEDEEFEDVFRLVAVVGQERVALPKTENYFEIVVPRFLLSDFKSHFRMSRTTFEDLSLIIGKDLDTPQSHVPVMKKLAVAVWYFGNLEVYRSLSDRFGISKSTAWECVIDVAKSLCARAQNFIHWPTDQEIPIIQQEFHEMANFPGVIGAIDGSHIKISAPHEHPDSYINRHGYHSINMQGICNSRMCFIDVFAGCCGSVNDARVWQLSTIREEIMRDYNRYFPEQTHILGDKIYPLEFNLLPPYKDNGHLTATQRHFNITHARTRQIIERVFALMKGRFRRLLFLQLQNVEYASLIILACCCLHNICISLNDILNEEVNDNENEDIPEDFNENNFEAQVQPENIPFNADLKRQIIAQQLFDIRQ